MIAEISIYLDVRRAKKDEVYPVKLRVYCDGKTELYGTIFNLSKDDFQKLDAKRVTTKFSKIREQINTLEKEAQKVADDLKPFKFEQFFSQFIFRNPLFTQKKKKAEKLLENNNSDEIKDEWLTKYPLLKLAHPFPDALSAIYVRLILSLLRQGRPGNAKSYHDSYMSYSKFKGNIPINEVTVDYLMQYESWMTKEQHRAFATVGMYARALRAVFNEAIEIKLIHKDAYPFGRRKYMPPTGRNLKKSIERKDIAAFYDISFDNQRQEKARDYWFFIYFGNGMNAKDFIQLKYRNIIDNYIVFARAKTLITSRGKDPIIVTALINEDMQRIINRYGNPDKDPDNYIFPVLRKDMTPVEEFVAKKNFIRWMNKNNKKTSKAAGLDRRPKTGDARHCTATHLKNAGAPTRFIMETLGHATEKTTENYLGGFEDEQKIKFAQLLNGFKEFNRTTEIIENGNTSTIPQPEV